MKTLIAFVLLAHCGANIPLSASVDATGKPGGRADVPDAASVDVSPADGPSEASVGAVANDATVGVDAAKDVPVEASVDVSVVDVMADVGVDAIEEPRADIVVEAACASVTAGNCCGVACPTGEHGAAPSCVAGRCVIACAPGWGNCDGNDANGCEVDLARVTAHCGACGAPCASGRVCSEGACATSCRAGLTMCSGACVDRQTDRANCGFCDRACDRARTCVSGRCV